MEKPSDKEPIVKEEAFIPISHAMGQTDVPPSPSRIVVLTNEGTEALLKLGVKPIGAAQSWVGDPWYEHLKSYMNGVEPVGFEHDPSIEKIAALQPDLIIGNRMRHEQIYEQLSRLAPTVYSEDLHSDWKINFSLYAEAVNKKQEGQDVLLKWDAYLEDSFQGNHEISVVRFMKDHARIYYKGSFPGVIIDEAGWSRPETQEVEKISEMLVDVEQSNQMNGDLLFYSTLDVEEEEAEVFATEWLLSAPFQSLDAFKNGNVMNVDDSVWHRSGGVLAAELVVEDIKRAINKK